MGPLQRTPGTAPPAFSQDPPWLRRRERISLVKNRMREICTSGSVRDGDGNAPIYSAERIAGHERHPDPGALGGGETGEAGDGLGVGPPRLFHDERHTGADEKAKDLRHVA